MWDIGRLSMLVKALVGRDTTKGDVTHFNLAAAEVSTQISILWCNAQNDSHLSTLRRSHKVCHTLSQNVSISFKTLTNYKIDIFGQIEYFLAQCGMARAFACTVALTKKWKFNTFLVDWITHSYDYSLLEKGISSFEYLLNIFWGLPLSALFDNFWQLLTTYGNFETKSACCILIPGQFLIILYKLIITPCYETIIYSC